MSGPILMRCPKHAVYFHYQCVYCLMNKTVNAKPRAVETGKEGEK
jgi:hypothetical protein